MKKLILLFAFLVVVTWLNVGTWRAMSANAQPGTPSTNNQPTVNQRSTNGQPGKYSYILSTQLEKTDKQKSLDLLHAAADSLYTPALNYLGFKYYSGQDVKRDISHALELIEKAADADDAVAASNLAWLLTDGEGVKHDCSKALFWLDRAVNAGNSAALSQMADIYREGKCEEADTLRAVSLYEKSYLAGYTPAKKALTDMMRQKWEKLPADSLFSLGRRYYFTGAPEIGTELLEMTSDSLSQPQRGITLMILSDAHSRAYGTFYDYSLANRLMVQAAVEGDPTAAFFLAEQLEIFPDFLDDYTDILENTPENLPIDEISSPAYWYHLASSNGVTDAVTAYRRLKL